MSAAAPSFFSRLFLSWSVYFRTLFDGKFAAEVLRLRSGEPALPPPEVEKPKQAKAKTKKKAEQPADETRPDSKKAKKAKAVVLREATPEAALQLLSLLQQEGRFIDFLDEDVSSFSDEEIGAAARVVHEGCKKALDQHFELEAIRDEEEGETLKLDEGFDAKSIRLTGNVSGEAPYKGELTHRGWRCTKVKLPQMTEGHDANVIAPAEVEL